MKKKILSLLLAICLIVPAICLMSACGEKKYDIEITTSTQIDHIQEIKFSSSNTKKTTYRNSEDTYIEVICDQGYAPDLEFSVYDFIINRYEDNFMEVYDYTSDPATVIGVRYIYTVPTKNLTGKQTVKYSGDTKAAKIRLTFNLEREYEDIDPTIGNYTGLSFVITNHNNTPIKTFATAIQFINFANEHGYLFVDYDEEVTITLNSSRPMNGTPMDVLSTISNHFVRFDAPDSSEEQLYCSWIYKCDVNFEISLILRWLQDVFPQE